MDENLSKKIQQKYLSIEEIFKLAYQVYTSSFKYVLLLVLTVILPQILVNHLMPDHIKFALFDENLLTSNNNSLIIYVYYVIITASVFIPLTMGFVGFITVKTIDNTPITMSNLIESIYSKWLSFTICGLLYFLTVVVTSTIIFLGIYLAVVFAFAPMFVFLNHKGFIRPFVQSKRLVKGRFFHILFFFILLIICSLIVNFSSSWFIFNFISNINTLGLFASQLFVETLNIFFLILFAIKFLNLLAISTYTEAN